jgi:hypothetical protein
MSSFFDSASLVQIPSGYSNGTLYSVKPIDGTGDLTFSRASNATRVASNGLIEKVRTNLVLQSNTFSTTWANSNSTETGGQAGYDGTNNAWLLTATSAGGFIYQDVTIAGLTTFSIYAKAGSEIGITLYSAHASQGRYFNLSTGALGGAFVGTPLDSKIESIGSGWYRCSITVSATATNNFRAYVSNGTANVAGNILIQAAQVETGDIATDYIATTSSAVSVGPVSGLPRLDYSGGATCPSLLLEPQRTNVLPQSNYFAAADWIKINGSIATNQATSPEGIGNASTFTEDTSSGFHVMYDNIVAAFSTAHTLSAFVKPNGRNIMYLRMENASTGSGLGITYFNISTGQILTDSSTSSSIEAYANGWYRVSITATTPSAQSTLFAIGLADVDNSRSYTGDGTSGIYLYGAQAEPSATYPTSLIPTNGTSVTRVGDIALKTSISSLIGQTEGTLFFDWIMNHESPNSSEDLYTLTMSDGTGNKIIGINNYNQTLAVFIKDTTTQFFDNSYTSGTDGARIKLALAYANNDVALYINGTQIATDSSATIPTLSQVRLNTFWNGNLPDSTSVNQLLLFKTRLTNADLATLTA